MFGELGKIGVLCRWWRKCLKMKWESIVVYFLYQAPPDGSEAAVGEVEESMSVAARKQRRNFGFKCKKKL